MSIRRFNKPEKLFSPNRPQEKGLLTYSSFNDAWAVTVEQFVDAGDGCVPYAGKVINKKTGSYVWWFQRQTGTIQVDQMRKDAKRIAQYVLHAIARICSVGSNDISRSFKRKMARLKRAVM